MITSILKCRMKLLTGSQTSTVAPSFEVWEWLSILIPRFIMDIWVLIHAGIKVNQFCTERIQCTRIDWAFRFAFFLTRATKIVTQWANGKYDNRDDNNTHYFLSSTSSLLPIYSIRLPSHAKAVAAVKTAARWWWSPSSSSSLHFRTMT